MKTTQERFFTDTYIAGLKPKAAPYKRSEKAEKGAGRLIVRVQPNGVKEFFYRYRPNGRDKTLAVGRYDPTRGGGKLADIRKAAEKAKADQREHGDVKEHRAAIELSREIEKRKGTFRQLLGAYVESLEKAGKPSHKQAAGVFQRNVFVPFPDLAKKRANEITPGDVQRILARMVKAGITRQVNVTRSYLKAAFTYGGGADYDPETAANDGVVFGLSANPVLSKRIKRFERVGERHLSEGELRAFWLALEALPVVQRATLRFNLAIAAQRPTQLLRADIKAFDWQENTLLLRDSKGRGGSRDHLLPLTAFALEQLKPLRELNGDADSFFTADGKRAMVVETLSKAVAEVSQELHKGQKIPAFDQRDLRRTVETMLQKLGIDKEVRAHLLSHGRSRGVQGQHYERYDFLPEKRQALERWNAHLQRVISGDTTAKVVAIRAG